MKSPIITELENTILLLSTLWLAIAKSFDAKIIKNTGNGLMFYFPKASCPTNTRAFKDILECGLAMIQQTELLISNYMKKAYHLLVTELVLITVWLK